jgi:hypothetical protein
MGSSAADRTQPQTRTLTDKWYNETIHALDRVACRLAWGAFRDCDGEGSSWWVFLTRKCGSFDRSSTRGGRPFLFFVPNSGRACQSVHSGRFDGLLNFPPIARKRLDNLWILLIAHNRIGSLGVCEWVTPPLIAGDEYRAIGVGRWFTELEVIPEKWTLCWPLL